jgi:hypothetical protein
MYLRRIGFDSVAILILVSNEKVQKWGSLVGMDNHEWRLDDAGQAANSKTANHFNTLFIAVSLC